MLGEKDLTPWKKLLAIIKIKISYYSQESLGTHTIMIKNSIHFFNVLGEKDLTPWIVTIFTTYKGTNFHAS